MPPVSNSVQTFYPGHTTYHETFARVVPSSAQEAKALVAEMQSEHVSSLYVADDGQPYGAVLALEVRSAAKTAGLTVSGSPGSAQGAFFGGSLASAASRSAATRFFDQAAASSASAKLFAPSGLYDSAFAAALSPAAQQRLVVSSPGFTPGKLPPAASAFTVGVHLRLPPCAGSPGRVRLRGDEGRDRRPAVGGHHAASRAVVVNRFRSLKRTGTAIGDYTIKGGDSSLAPFVFARVRSGTLIPFRFASLAGLSAGRPSSPAGVVSGRRVLRFCYGKRPRAGHFALCACCSPSASLVCPHRAVESPARHLMRRTSMRHLGKAWRGGLIIGSILALSACGSSSSRAAVPEVPVVRAAVVERFDTIDIYSSLPLQGASTAQTGPLVNGIKLALAEAGGKAGKFTVNYQSLDDSTAAAGKWDPGQTAADARKVASDPKAVYYIGEFNSGASEVSIPILNQAGIPMVSPANTYVGLTTKLPGSAAGEPNKYYPSGKRNYLRIVPIDSIQAAAGLIAMKNAGCTKIAVANDKEAYGAGLATLLGLEKGFYGDDRHQQHRHRPDGAELPQLREHDPGTGSGLLLLLRDRLQRRGAADQGRPCSAAQGEDLRPGRRLHGLLHQPEDGRRAGRDRSADPVHGRHAGPCRLSGRQGLPGQVQGQVRRPHRIRTRSTAMRR